MKPHRPSPDEESLSSLLKEWQSNAELPPRFEEAVWRRIAAAETASRPPRPFARLGPLVRRWIDELLTQPALAAAYVAALLALGAGFGWDQARQQSQHVRTELGARYAQSVDPYQATINLP